MDARKEHGGSTYYKAGGQTIAVCKGSTLNFLLSDHDASLTGASTSKTVDHISARVLTEIRDPCFVWAMPWGEDRYSSCAPPASCRYTGQRSEPDLGLYFYKSRWYDPSIIQFNQPDTLIPDPYNPLDWNRYAYVRYNPLKYVDPSGHFCEMVGSNEICSADSDSNGHWLPSSQHFERGTASPLSNHPQVDLIKQNIQETIDTGLRIILEPYDWARVGVDCYNGECSGWDFLGLLPLLPAGVTKYGDDLLVPARELYYSQKRISATTKGATGMYLDDLANSMAQGWKGSPLRVLNVEGRLVSLDNRRLPMAKMLDIDVPVRISPGTMDDLLYKHSRDGIFSQIRVRATRLIIDMFGKFR